jgi:tetratricopeptide (TPR) repeat protein
MREISNRTKRLVAELTVLVCIVGVWIVKSQTFDVNDVKAGVFEQVVKVDPDNADACCFLAGYYMDSGSYEKAVNILRQVVKIDPNDASAYSTLGDAYWNCNRYEEAITAYKQSMVLNVKDPRVHYQLALVYLEMGDKDSAMDECKILKGMDKKLADQLLGIFEK